MGFFFGQGEWKAPQVLKDELTSFVPRYVDILFSEQFRDEIVEVRIEGHTSSEYAGHRGPQAYMPNLKLSQRRTRHVVGLLMSVLRETGRSEEQREWLRSKLSADGLSSARLVPLPGCVTSTATSCEDERRSRRVSFRARTASERKIVKILRTLGESTGTPE